MVARTGQFAFVAQFEQVSIIQQGVCSLPEDHFVLCQSGVFWNSGCDASAYWFRNPLH